MFSKSAAPAAADGEKVHYKGLCVNMQLACQESYLWEEHWS